MSNVECRSEIQNSPVTKKLYLFRHSLFFGSIFDIGPLNNIEYRMSNVECRSEIQNSPVTKKLYLFRHSLFFGSIFDIGPNSHLPHYPPYPP
jgi:hypothetical protein